LTFFFFFFLLNRNRLTISLKIIFPRSLVFYCYNKKNFGIKLWTLLNFWR
jgi:hypothetical protein